MAQALLSVLSPSQIDALKQQYGISSISSASTVYDSKIVSVARDDPVKEPLSKATKKTRSEGESGFLKTGGNIAAIDFGTSSVSLAYSVADKDKSDVAALKLDDINTRLPNVIMIERDTCATTIGKAALRFLTYAKTKKSQYHYFPSFKMLLRDKDLSREKKVLSFTGESFYLVEVIAFMLKHLKKKLYSHIELGGLLCNLHDLRFDWVITVPAIWDSKGKRMMREAAYLAGLLDGDGITKFTEYQEGVTLKIPEAENPERLTLALEPEAAAIYSQKYTSGAIANQEKNATIAMPKCYMVVDAGAGTIDITVQHEDEAGGINVISLPTGNAWGGSKVNQLFSEMLQTIVGDKDFEHFEKLSVLSRILQIEFEQQKVAFGNEEYPESAVYVVDLPGEFIRSYGEERIRKGCSKYSKEELKDMSPKDKEEFKFEDDSIHIPYSVFDQKLVRPVAKHALASCLSAFSNLQLSPQKVAVDTVYLVGGFGGCRYMKEKVEEGLDEHPDIKANVNIVVPRTADIAVVTGAALWRQHPEVIKARTADATYGVGMAYPFVTGKHDPYYEYTQDDGKVIANNIFEVYLQRGQTARADEVFIVNGTYPSKSDATQVTYTIYSTPRRDIQYIRDKNKKLTVDKLAALTIDVPDVHLPRTERIIDFTMDFSGTEILAIATYRRTGTTVKTVCDFLSVTQQK